MGFRKNFIYLFISSVVLSASLTGCGGDEALTTSPTLSTQAVAPVPCPNATATPVPAKITTKTATTTKAVTPVTTTTKTDTTKATVTTTKTDTTAKADTTKTDTSVEDAKTKGRKILDKVLATITTPNAISSQVDKYEKGLKDGNVVQQSFNVWDKKPGKVKIEVTYHTKASTIGAKIAFDVGTGKATVRPGGALSFITKEFPQNDDNLISPNGYTPEQIDFFSMTKRLSEPLYEAELTGKTTLNGAEIYLLKVTAKGTNDLDANISYEMIGFDVKTFQIKTWEAYAASSKDAFFRINIKSFIPSDTLSDDIFKV